MTTFMQAMDAEPKRTVGENGAPSLTAAGVGDARVALFFKLVRNLPQESMEALMDAVLAQADRAPAGQAAGEIAADLFVMAFQTRDVREGKGEKKLFTEMMLHLHKRQPAATLALVKHVAEFGCFKDLTVLAKACDGAEAQPLRRAALTALAGALKADAAVPEGSKKASLSLAAKWAPREGRADDALAKELAKEHLFPKAPDARARYRKLVAGLNKRLATVEVGMCSGAWDADPSKVPARCLNLQKEAFYNRVAGGKRKGERRSEAPERLACAERFDAHVKLARSEPSKARVHGANMQPHELVAKYLRGQEEDDVYEAQWIDLRERLRVAAAEAGATKTGEGEEGAAPRSLGKMVPLVDTSGSMSGQPMEVAVALGLLVSELTAEEFKHRVLTFNAVPTWHALPKGGSLKERTSALGCAPWGMNTDFAAALKLILERCISADLPAEAVADLSMVVFSDMQFDVAQAGHRGRGAEGAWATHYERLVKEFDWAGRKTSHKKPYPVPRVIFWNLRGDTRDFPADATTPGVDLVSGFSASMLKLFLSGDVGALGDAAREAKLPPEERATALDTMRAALDAARYDGLRADLSRAFEGRLRGYAAPAAVESAEGAPAASAASDEAAAAEAAAPAAAEAAAPAPAEAAAPSAPVMDALGNVVRPRPPAASAPAAEAKKKAADTQMAEASPEEAPEAATSEGGGEWEMV